MAAHRLTHSRNQRGQMCPLAEGCGFAGTPPDGILHYLTRELRRRRPQASLDCRSSRKRRRHIQGKSRAEAPRRQGAPMNSGFSSGCSDASPSASAICCESSIARDAVGRVARAAGRKGGSYQRTKGGKLLANFPEKLQPLWRHFVLPPSKAANVLTWVTLSLPRRCRSVCEVGLWRWRRATLLTQKRCSRHRTNRSTAKIPPRHREGAR